MTFEISPCGGEEAEYISDKLLEKIRPYCRVGDITEIAVTPSDVSQEN